MLRKPSDLAIMSCQQQRRDGRPLPVQETEIQPVVSHANTTSDQSQAVWQETVIAPKNPVGCKYPVTGQPVA
jgi:hypothetical protein